MSTKGSYQEKLLFEGDQNEESDQSGEGDQSRDGGQSGKGDQSVCEQHEVLLDTEELARDDDDAVKSLDSLQSLGTPHPPQLADSTQPDSEPVTSSPSALPQKWYKLWLY